MISAIIPASVDSIGNSAFYNCNSLKSVTIPSSVTSIGGYAFGYCNALNSVTAGYSVPLNLSNSQNVFYNVNTSTCKLNVPFNTKSLYAAASQWKNFTNIIESTVGFKLSSNIVKLADTSGSRTSVDVTSNIAWTATSNQTWLSISPTSGNGNGSIEITASANPEPKVRNAKITISGTGVSSQTISVAQEAKALSLEIAPGELAKALSQIEKATITKLKLTGKIDARDFKTMRDGMPKLTIIDLNEVNIVAYSGYEGTVYNTTTYPDNQIPQNAFCSSNNSSDAKAGLTSFIYPSSATSVGEYAFNGCSGLTFVTIPSSVDSIGRNAYSNCQNLSYINFPEGIIKIGNSAFYNCGSLGSIAIPSSVTTIEANAFSTCGKLSSAIISEGVTSIGESAFTNCVSLTSVTIPSSVLSIGKNAFNTCEKLVTANISEGVSSIGESAFTNCVSLTSVTIPSSVLSIGKNAFNTCKLLSSAIISEGVKTIGESAFYECGSLSSIIIPSSVASIGNGAFSYCKKLSSLTISEGVGSIGNSAFSVCNSISSVTIPSSVKTIGDFAFNNCEILNSVIISEGVKSIGSNSFSWCPALISVEISSSVKSIGNSAFEVCKKLSSVTISEGVTSIGEYAFISCISLTSVFIPSSVISIGKKAFSNCVNLSSVIAGASIPIDLSYSDEVFSGINKNNCKLYVPSDSKYLYVVASQWKDFINIVEISGVFLSSNSIGMGHRASTALMNLVSNLSWTASSDQAWLIINPSSGSGGINTITFTSTTNPTVDTRIAKVTISAKGISPQEITLSQLGNVEVTAGNLKNIIGEQFSNITNLDLTGTIDARDFKTMRDDMPLLADLDLSGVEIVAYSGTDGTESNKTESTDYPANAIPYYAFTNLEDLEKTPSLKSIILPLSATSINRNAFHGCSKLTSITIPPSILSIEEYAFAYCDALGSITIPSSTISIGSGVFISSSGFLTVDEKNPNYSSSEGVFYNKNKTTLINCPISKTGNYNIPATVTSIEGYAFFSCNRLTLVTIPSSVLSIGFYAFWGCSGLTSINIPSSVTTLGSNALRFCSSLTSITTARFLPLNLADYDFMGIKINTCILYVPYGSKAAYQAAIQWKEFENIVEMPNNAPIANAGLDEVVNENALAILDGTGSSDADGNILTYYWTAPTGITLSSVTAAKPTFTAPEVTTDKTFTFSLVVNNGTVYSPVDQVVVVVRQVDKAPHVLNSIENVSVDKRAPGQIIDLKTVFADDDFGDVLSYSVSSNSNNQVVTVSITGSELSLSFSTANTGISDIVITASSNGKEVQSKFQVEVKVPTGIADVANGHEVQIYPNPTKGKLYLKFNHIPEAGTILEVYSASGNLIHKSFINSQDKTLNLNGNSPGVYFIRIGEKDIRTTRIVLE